MLIWFGILILIYFYWFISQEIFLTMSLSCKIISAVSRSTRFLIISYKKTLLIIFDVTFCLTLSSPANQWTGFYITGITIMKELVLLSPISHSVKSARIQSFCGPYFPTFELNPRIPYIAAFNPNAGKYRPEKLWIRTFFTQFHSCHSSDISDNNQ